MTQGGSAYFRLCEPESSSRQEPAKPAAHDELSAWRAQSIQETLCELRRQQSGLEKSVHSVFEMQQELRQALHSELKSCLQQALAEWAALPVLPPPLGTSLRESSTTLPEEPEKPGAATAAKRRSSGKSAASEERHVTWRDHQRVRALVSKHSVPTKRLPLLQLLVNSPYFDVLMGFMIILNFATIFAEAEFRAWDLDAQLRGGTVDGSISEGFDRVEATFNGLFLLELLLRLAAHGLHLFRSPIDVLDACVILLSAVDSFVLDPLADGFRHMRIIGMLRVARVFRALRLLRVLRFLQLMAVLSPLRVLVRTLAMSVDSLFWSLAVLGSIVISAALLVTNLLTDFLEDESQPLEDREWLYAYFGSATRASYTMFEATFSGIWASRLSRRMIEISPWFMLFWCAYTCTVTFAVIRVLSALFLKRTLDVARIDAERMAQAKMEEKEKVVAIIREVFRMADQLGDGVLHRWEFEAMMENPQVLALFHEVELETPELQLLFGLLCQDNTVDQEEFLKGAMKIKSTHVKPVDVVQVLHELGVLRRHFDDFRDGLERMDSALHPDQPWRSRKSIATIEKRKKGLSFLGADVDMEKSEGAVLDDE